MFQVSVHISESSDEEDLEDEEGEGKCVSMCVHVCHRTLSCYSYRLTRTLIMGNVFV